MKVKMYIDLDDNIIADIENGYCIMATNKPTMHKILGQSRYVFEVDLPVHHFKAIADREVDAVLIGKEEE